MSRLMKPACHPDLPEGSPFAHPNAFQDWVIRRSELAVPYDVVIFAKDGQSAYDRLFVDHRAEFAVHSSPSGHVFFRMRDGRFAVIATDTSQVEELWPDLELWNWWTEGDPDLESLREKNELQQKISGVRFH